MVIESTKYVTFTVAKSQPLLLEFQNHHNTFTHQYFNNMCVGDGVDTFGTFVSCCRMTTETFKVGCPWRGWWISYSPAFLRVQIVTVLSGLISPSIVSGIPPELFIGLIKYGSFAYGRCKGGVQTALIQYLSQRYFVTAFLQFSYM